MFQRKIKVIEIPSDKKDHKKYEEGNGDIYYVDKKGKVYDSEMIPYTVDLEIVTDLSTRASI